MKVDELGVWVSNDQHPQFHRNCGVGMCMWMPRPVWDDDTEWEAGLEKAGGRVRDLRWASLV